MTTMTDARAVEVLAAMREDGGVVADADYRAAIDHVIARLREPADAQAQGGGDVYGYEHDGRYWSRDGATPWVIHHAVPLYTAPKSAPVGVEAIRQARAIIDHVIHGEPGYELSAAHDLLTTALAQQPAADAHCATCSCVPGMTPAVRFNTTPAEREGAVRDHLIRMGWTPPAEAQAQGGGEVVAYGVYAKSEEYPKPVLLPEYVGSMDVIRGRVLSKARREGFTGDFVERMAELGWWIEPLTLASAPPSAPVGLVEAVRALKAKYQQHIDADHFPYHFWRDLESALAQQPAAVDVFDLDCPHSAIGGCDLCAAQPGGSCHE